MQLVSLARFFQQQQRELKSGYACSTPRPDRCPFYQIGERIKFIVNAPVFIKYEIALTLRKKLDLKRVPPSVSEEFIRDLDRWKRKLTKTYFIVFFK